MTQQGAQEVLVRTLLSHSPSQKTLYISQLDATLSVTHPPATPGPRRRAPPLESGTGHILRFLK